ncbi:MAG: hypothetical protein JWN03_9072 [Nocardia sp.]|uniref:hypothetical protein n=1 Tax=Nocardia sp. TaxID=1821 RepID=UPI002603ECF7|nr:hypothetical protein [Nocardia sp.]MCU1648797.1 hypothetical protein [Nocardia sp.]
MLGLGSLGVLFGLYLPLVHYPGLNSDYSLMSSSQELGTPGVYLLIAGAVLVLVAACLLFEKVQTPAKLGAVLVLACVESVGCLFVYAVAFTLIWTASPDLIDSDARTHYFVEAGFRYGALVPVLSCGLMIAGALWWYIDARQAREN